MDPAERHPKLIYLLAKIDQQIAKREALASQEVRADDEVEFLAIQLKFRRDARERVEMMLSAAVDSQSPRSRWQVARGWRAQGRRVPRS